MPWPLSSRDTWPFKSTLAKDLTIEPTLKNRDTIVNELQLTECCRSAYLYTGSWEKAKP